MLPSCRNAVLLLSFLGLITLFLRFLFLLVSQLQSVIWSQFLCVGDNWCFSGGFVFFGPLSVSPTFFSSPVCPCEVQTGQQPRPAFQNQSREKGAQMFAPLTSTELRFVRSLGRVEGAWWSHRSGSRQAHPGEIGSQGPAGCSGQPDQWLSDEFPREWQQVEHLMRPRLHSHAHRSSESLG